MRRLVATVLPLVVASGALAAAPAAHAAPVDKRAATAVAKRAASAHVERLGLAYPPSAWRAACYRRTEGGWRCEMGTNGQCSGAVTVLGTRSRPRAARLRVWCFE